jgi:hypothetical protein
MLAEMLSALLGWVLDMPSAPKRQIGSTCVWLLMGASSYTPAAFFLAKAALVFCEILIEPGTAMVASIETSRRQRTRVSRSSAR